MAEGRILIVERDRQVQRLLESSLQRLGYETTLVDTGFVALESVVDTEPDAVILDLEVADLSGLEVCRRLREWSSVPILMISVEVETRMKIAALEAGADDFITKPLHSGEVVARIRAIRRRAGETARTEARIVHLGDLTVDLPARQVRRGSDSVSLTRTEFDLLRQLARHVDRAVTYDELLRSVWGPGHYDVRLVHVHMSSVRRKLKTRPSDIGHIVCLPGIGYRLGRRV